ncbi:bifunctional demethylmenaquinone methyltransferase/2-methoxy-6-polyprenyl-1,4-benzoquinol methylase UbiE [Bartonella tamiae]|uniref:Ubiquinone/menaquinone biosynthesis C-methyltransferase UbiE n=1 Tax=Bartonella tamiae Th239 TaxID=1094558 RepID=J0ZR62_9HYPH|nr:bifunctional demethylmenaquinone methyltransferase/2-methoxy-6-polyprenyl-1,4-benzoquinol methylase UbiE [Bartonella tamiae]EJF91173.1 ubiquinone/menaquinone biosynthesis methyltransferase ubiE [Bartonella tamiae Th239]EJF93162.1 ubiquinone/menaquinone biosynthesis methyltransferase ubiE [Bartonella tamiae Th307]
MSFETKRVGTQGGMEKSFGFQTVAENQKQTMVNDVFHSVAKKYDIMNDVMSIGMHRLWKDAFVSWLSPSKTKNWNVLDVAGGTGDIAFRIVEASNRQAHATVLDINSSMLEVGTERAQKKGLSSFIDFIEANAENLPFDEDSFDAYTIAFGIRNVPHIDQALSEAFRVLKPGGRFMCLEFSEVEMPILDKIYDLWSFHGIPRVGQMIAGDADSYKYLVESIRKFPKQTDFAAMISKAGFSHVSYRNLNGGIAAIHSAWKI